MVAILSQPDFERLDLASVQEPNAAKSAITTQSTEVTEART